MKVFIGMKVISWGPLIVIALSYIAAFAASYFLLKADVDQRSGVLAERGVAFEITSAA